MSAILTSNYNDDSFLPYLEAKAKWEEKTERQLDQYRLSDHNDFKDFHRRKGEVIHSSRFIQRLLKLEPRLIVKQQIMHENDWGLYLQTGSKVHFICQVTKGFLTEFSWTTVDYQNLPDEPKWGWRTVLVRLMAKGVLQWDTVVKEFGHSQGANSDRWFQYTEPYRNHHASGVVHRNLRAQFEN